MTKTRLFFFAIALLLGQACSKPEQPIQEIADSTAIEQFNQAIYCAALMGVYQQILQQSVTEQVKSAVGFTLGHASNINNDHKLGKNTQQAFAQKTLTLYTNLTADSVDSKATEYERCASEAKLYDPKTQIPALIEKAKTQSKTTR